MLSALLAFATPAPVTFEAPAGRAEDLLPALGRAIGTNLWADESVADDVVLISVKGKPASEVLGAISQATGAEWRADSMGRTLVRTATAIANERRTAISERKRSIEDSIKRWSANYPPQTWDQKESHAFIKRQANYEHGVDEPLPVRYDLGPVAPVISSVLSSLKDQPLDELSRTGVVSFSTEPVSNQRPMAKGVALIDSLNGNFRRLNQSVQELGVELSSINLSPRLSIHELEPNVVSIDVRVSYVAGYLDISYCLRRDDEYSNYYDAVRIGQEPNQLTAALILQGELSSTTMALPQFPTFGEINKSIVGPTLTAAARRDSSDIVAALSDVTASQILALSEPSEASIVESLGRTLRLRKAGSLLIGGPTADVILFEGRESLPEHFVMEFIRPARLRDSYSLAPTARWSSLGLITTANLGLTNNRIWNALGSHSSIANRLFFQLPARSRTDGGRVQIKELSPSARETIRLSQLLSAFGEQADSEPIGYPSCIIVRKSLSGFSESVRDDQYVTVTQSDIDVVSTPEESNLYQCAERKMLDNLKEVLKKIEANNSSIEPFERLLQTPLLHGTVSERNITVSGTHNDDLELSSRWMKLPFKGPNTIRELISN